MSHMDAQCQEKQEETRLQKTRGQSLSGSVADHAKQVQERDKFSYQETQWDEEELQEAPKESTKMKRKIDALQVTTAQTILMMTLVSVSYLTCPTTCPLAATAEMKGDYWGPSQKD